MALVSFDTNLWLYAVDRTAGTKREAVLDLLRRGAIGGRVLVLLQTMSEFSSVSLRKFGAAPEGVSRQIAGWTEIFPVAAATTEDLTSALALMSRWKLSWWDALLLATALRNGVTTLLSEDLQDGIVIGGLKVLNPFTEANAQKVGSLLPG